MKLFFPEHTELCTLLDVLTQNRNGKSEGNRANPKERVIKSSPSPLDLKDKRDAKELCPLFH